MAPLPVEIWHQSSKLLDKLRSYYGKPTDTAPLVSHRTALSCAILYTVLYVAPFYLSPTLRSSPLQDRNAPAVISARARAVGLTCLACTVTTVYILAIYGHATPQDVLRLLGIWPVAGLDILQVYGLVATLFVGPLYESLVIDGDWRGWSIAAFKERVYDSWTGWRNLVIAPASEELVFRSLTISLYLLAKVSPAHIVFVTPLIFGLAHIHHLIEFLQSRTPQGHRLPPMNVWISGLARSVFQFTYTSLFGFFAAFVFLRTGNVWAVIVAHSFCNSMGVPRMYGKVGQFDDDQTIDMTPDVAQGKRDDGANEPVKINDGPVQGTDGIERKAAVAVGLKPKNLGIGWTVVYYALLVVGAYGFYRCLIPLTESSNALAVFR